VTGARDGRIHPIRKDEIVPEQWDYPASNEDIVSKFEEGSLETPERKPSCYGDIPVRPRAAAGDAWGKKKDWKETLSPRRGCSFPNR
jgi:hypothetical protein